MAIFKKKSKNQTLEPELAALRQRVGALDAKRVVAEAELAAATEARQVHHISGDLDDAKTAQMLQDRVNAAASQIVGLEDAIAVVQAQIVEIEQKINAERTQAERHAAADKLTLDVAEIESALQGYVAGSRRFADALGAAGHWHFESGAMERFARDTKAQIETAASFAVQDLRGIVTAIRDGAAPIPPKKPEAAPIAGGESVPPAVGAEPPFKYHTPTGRPTFRGATSRSAKIDAVLAAADIREFDPGLPERKITIAAPRF